MGYLLFSLSPLSLSPVLIIYVRILASHTNLFPCGVCSASTKTGFPHGCHPLTSNIQCFVWSNHPLAFTSILLPQVSLQGLNTLQPQNITWIQSPCDAFLVMVTNATETLEYLEEEEEELPWNYKGKYVFFGASCLRDLKPLATSRKMAKTEHAIFVWWGSLFIYFFLLSLSRSRSHSRSLFLSLLSFPYLSFVLLLYFLYVLSTSHSFSSLPLSSSDVNSNVLYFLTFFILTFFQLLYIILVSHSIRYLYACVSFFPSPSYLFISLYVLHYLSLPIPCFVFPSSFVSYFLVVDTLILCFTSSSFSSSSSSSSSS